MGGVDSVLVGELDGVDCTAWLAVELCASSLPPEQADSVSPVAAAAATAPILAMFVVRIMHHSQWSRGERAPDGARQHVSNVTTVRLVPHPGQP